MELIMRMNLLWHLSCLGATVGRSSATRISCCAGDKDLLSSGTLHSADNQPRRRTSSYRWFCTIVSLFEHDMVEVRYLPKDGKEEEGCNKRLLSLSIHRITSCGSTQLGGNASHRLLMFLKGISWLGVEWHDKFVRTFLDCLSSHPRSSKRTPFANWINILCCEFLIPLHSSGFA